MKIVVLKTLLAISVLALLGAVGFLVLLQPGSEAESKPKRTVAPISLQAVESKFSVQIKTPHSPLQEASRQSLVRMHRDTAPGPEVCASDRSGVEICGDASSEFLITSETVSLGLVADNAFYVAVLFSVTGKITKVGNNSGNLPSFHKVFSAKVKTHSKFMLSIDSDWCIRSTVSPNFKWIEGGDIREKGVRVKLKSALESRLTKLLEKMGDGVVSTIQCDDIRQQVQHVWRTRSIPLEIPDNKQQQYIDIQPTAIGYSNLRLKSGYVKFDLNVSAKTDISTKAIASKPLPMPKSRVERHKARTIDLALFYQLPYRKIVSELSDLLVDKPLSSRTRFGTFSLSVKSIEVYPVKDLLAIGLLVDADNSEEWFGKSNWIYLLVRPKSNQETREVQLSFQKFAAGMEPGLSLAIKETVVPKLEKVILASFKKPVESTKDAITKVLEHENMIDGMDPPSISIKQTTLLGSAVLIEIVFAFTAGMEVVQKSQETDQKQSGKPSDSAVTEPMILYEVPDIPE